MLSACNHVSHKGAVQADEVIVEAPVSEKIKEEVMPVNEYIKWVKDPRNGLLKIKAMDELEYAVQYKPYPYIICMEEQTDKLADTMVSRKIKELESVQYYDLKISLKDGQGELLKSKLGSADEYDKRVKYFAFGMQQDIQLVDGTDTLPCIMYHFERAYDVAPYCTVLLGFENDKTKSGKQKTVLVYDKTFNKGLLKFTFKENRLQTLPKLLTL
jgi:hypothetical protein